MKVSENPTQLTDAELKQLAIAEYQKTISATKPKHKFPTETITLPSRGKVYDPNSVLRSGEIEMKYMTAGEEDLLASPNLIKKGKVIERLIEALVVTPGFNINELVFGDKNALLVAARILSIGKTYDVKVECVECGKSSPQSIDLSLLPETEFNPPVDCIVEENEFKFVLPHSKRTLTFKLLTHDDEIAIQKELEAIALRNKGKKSEISKELSTRVKHMILSVDGNRDRNDIIDFVENSLLSMDSKELRKFSGSITPNISFTTNAVCKECGYSEEGVSFELDAVTFLWPS